MRRIAAMLLVSVFSFSPIGPALFVDADSNLPACCRRGGQHHCAMMDMDRDAAPSTGLGLQCTRCEVSVLSQGRRGTAASRSRPVGGLLSGVHRAFQPTDRSGASRSRLSHFVFPFPSKARTSQPPLLTTI